MLCHQATLSSLSHHGKMRVGIRILKAFIVCVALTPPRPVSCYGHSILVLGGNGFLGSETVNQLLDEGNNITILNRGNEYFDSERRIIGNVHRHFRCDRKTLLRKTCPELYDGTYYDVAIDFSSYKDQEIEQMIQALNKRVGLYVLISTDAVYDVRRKIHDSETREADTELEIQNRNHSRRSEETHAYGYNKLQAEERLREQRKHFGFPFVILRLADAIGERDTTLRWWTYQLWIKLHKRLNLPIPLPKAIARETFSMVYSSDVAEAIVKIAKDPRGFQDVTINLAFADKVHLQGLLEHIAHCLDITDLEYNGDEKTAWYRYPSAESGPISVEKAIQLLNWVPTKLEVAINKTCTFFEHAMVGKAFARDRELMLASFLEDAVPASFHDDELFVSALIESYGPKVFEDIDLGFNVDPNELRITDEKSEL